VSYRNFRMFRPARLALAFLCFGCATTRVPAEKIDSWMTRSSAAWTAMKDDGQPVPGLDRAFAQTGMSTSSTILFVLVPGKATAPWSVKGVEAIGKGPLAASEYAVSERGIGRSVRLEISRLAPAQRYRVTFATGDAARPTELLESRTAPELTEPTSVIVTSCNEPWNRSRPDLNSVGVAAASTSSLRSIDLRANGSLPIALGRDGVPPQQFERPSFLVALGDQAYVDAEPEEEGSLALFGGPRSNELRVDVTDPAQWPQVLDRIYRMHFLIPTFHRALTNLPSTMVWDDHEIRDGWGSQRDEATLIPKTQQPWMEYFAATRKLTWEIEVAGNLNAGGEEITAFDARLDRELDTSFSWGDQLQVFLLDTRTVRGRPEGLVMSDAQVERVANWFKPCGAKPSVFLFGVPVPMSVNHDDSVSAAGKALASELEDDINDGWWATTTAQSTRMRLETMIVDHAHRCPDDRIVVVSGDVHESGLVAIAREGKIIAYEVISSGIASMVLNGALSRAILATRTEYFAKSETGITYSGIGRISTGSSFAELFFEFPAGAPPRIRTLFYPTTQIDVLIDSTLINVGAALKGTVWQTGSTTVGQLAAGTRLTQATSAVELEYGIKPPRSKEYNIAQSALRCSTDLGVFSWGTRIDERATDWSTVLDLPPVCLPRP
jgi:hypothetical protein